MDQAPRPAQISGRGHQTGRLTAWEACRRRTAMHWTVLSVLPAVRLSATADRPTMDRFAGLRATPPCVAATMYLAFARIQDLCEGDWRRSSRAFRAVKPPHRFVSGSARHRLCLAKASRPRRQLSRVGGSGQSANDLSLPVPECVRELHREWGPQAAKGTPVRRSRLLCTPQGRDPRHHGALCFASGEVLRLQSSSRRLLRCCCCLCRTTPPEREDTVCVG
mmetsp:Transcript_3547/g.11043  ORF Transcript_3547/g.11043 Transcript_3547/m.11043 type:complete len:221 (-) Transcript_3547:2314-2976(-)